MNFKPQLICQIFFTNIHDEACDHAVCIVNMHMKQSTKLSTVSVWMIINAKLDDYIPVDNPSLNKCVASDMVLEVHISIAQMVIALW